jgi:hypothetical protein
MKSELTDKQKQAFTNKINKLTNIDNKQDYNSLKDNDLCKNPYTKEIKYTPDELDDEIEKDNKFAVYFKNFRTEWNPEVMKEHRIATNETEYN